MQINETPPPMQNRLRTPEVLLYEYGLDNRDMPSDFHGPGVTTEPKI